jgi:hypothetical protein
MQKDLIVKVLASHGGFAALTLRVPIGLIFAAHGGQRLFLSHTGHRIRAGFISSNRDLSHYGWRQSRTRPSATGQFRR